MSAKVLTNLVVSKCEGQTEWSDPGYEFNEYPSYVLPLPLKNIYCPEHNEPTKKCSSLVGWACFLCPPKPAS